MKFYRDKKYKFYIYYLFNNKLTAIYSYIDYVGFYKNNFHHNVKNAAHIKNAAHVSENKFKFFYLNGNLYGKDYDFTKKSWRRFIKLNTFL